MRVESATETVTVVPFSEPSFGPVQRTPTLSELAPTAVTWPANQGLRRWLCGFGAGTVVVTPVVVVGELSAAAMPATERNTPTAKMRIVLRMIFSVRFVGQSRNAKQLTVVILGPHG